MKVGGQAKEADEPNFARLKAIIHIEFEVYPEPKVLLPEEHAILLKRFKSNCKAAKYIGTSEALSGKT